MKYLLRIVGAADGSRRTPFDGKLLAAYDPRRPGVGPDGMPLAALIEVTDDPADALQFVDKISAHACWCAESGLPHPADKPLTYFTVAIEEFP